MLILSRGNCEVSEGSYRFFLVHGYDVVADEDLAFFGVGRVEYQLVPLLLFVRGHCPQFPINWTRDLSDFLLDVDPDPAEQVFLLSQNAHVFVVGQQ